MRKLFVLLAVLLVLPGCGSGGEEDETDAAQPSLQIRKVALSAAFAGATDPPEEWAERFASFVCPTGEVEEAPSDDYALLCDEAGIRYLLEPASWAGAVAEATAEVPDKEVAWVVNIDLDAAGAAAFADLSRELVGTEQQVAMVLDGHLLSAPTLNAVIPDGKMQIAGNFTEEAANLLADRLAGR